MRTLALIRWELVQTARGLALHLAITLVALGSLGLIAAGVFLLDQWSPFPSTTPVARPETASGTELISLLGEHRGGGAFFIILAWLLLLAAVVGPALMAGTIVRDRRSGRLDRVLTDASRADAVALAKLLAGLIPLGIVLMGVGPTASFAWLVGGLAQHEALASLGVLLVLVILIAAVGLACSAIATTEASALAIGYLAIGTLLLGPLVVGAGLILAGSRAAAAIVLSFDPLIALLAVQSRLAVGLSRVVLSDASGIRFTWEIQKLRIPVWAADALVYVLVAVILVWLTSVLIEPLHPLKTWRLRRAQRKIP